MARGADGSVNIDTKLDPKGLSQGLDRLGKEAEKSSGRLKGALGTMGKAAGVALAAVGAGLVTAGKYVVDAGIEFESAFAGVIKTVDATPAQLEKMRQGIIDMSREMPASAAEIASVAEAAGQLGISNDQILNFTRSMVNLGVATNMSAEEAATSLARFANIMGNAAKDTDPKYYDRLGSAIVALGNNFATTESEIVEMSLRLAGAGQQIGLSESDVLALSATMSSLGINAEAGGSAMSRVLSKMNSAVIGNGSELRKYAKAAGVSAKDFAAAWSEDPMKAFQMFTAGLDGIAAAGGDVDKVLKGLGLSDIRITDMLKRMAGNEEMLAMALELANGEWISHNALTKEAELRYATLESQVAIFGNNIKALAISVYDSMRDSLADMVRFGNDQLNILYEGWQKGGIDGLLESVGTVLGNVISKVTELAPKLADAAAKVIKSLTATLKKNIRPVATAAAQIATTLIRSIIDVLPDLLEMGVEIVIALVEGITGALPELIPLAAEMMVSLATGLIKAIPRLLAAIPQIVRGLIGGFRNVEWSELWKSLVASLDEARTGITKVWGELKGELSQVDWADVGRAILDGIRTVLTGVGAFIKELITGDANASWPEVGNAILAGIKSVLSAAGGIIKKLVTGDANADWSDVAGVIWNSIKTAFGTMASLLKELVTGNRNATWNDVALTIWNGVKAAFASLGTLVKELITGDGNAEWADVASAVWEGVKAAFGALGSLLKELVTGNGEATWTEVGQTIWNGVKAVFGTLGSLLKELVTGNKNATWNDVAQTIWEGVKTAFGLLGSLLKELITGDGNAEWSDVAETITDGIKTAILGEDGAEASWGEVGAKIAGWLGAGLSTAGELLSEAFSTAWSVISGLDWASVGETIRGVFKDIETTVTGWLGLTTLSFRDVQKVVNSFSMPESFEMKELQAAKADVGSLIEEITALQTKVDTTVLQLKMGVELTDGEAKNFGEMLDRIVKAGIETVEASNYNLNLNLSGMFDEGSVEYDELWNGLFQPGQEALLSIATEKGTEVMDAYKEAMTDGNLTAEEAARIAVLAKQFEAEVNKALGDIKIKAQMLELQLQTADNLLKPKDLENIVTEANRIVTTAFEQAKNNHAENRTVMIEYAAAIGLDVEETQKYLATWDEGLADQLSTISLEGVNNILNSMGEQLSPDALISHFEKLGADVSSYVQDGGFLDLDLSSADAMAEFNAYFNRFFEDMNIQGFYSDLEGMAPATQERVAALVKAMEPNTAQMQEARALYEQLGIELPQGLVDGLEKMEMLEAIAGGNEKMFAYLQDAVKREMEATGATFGEAWTAVSANIADVLSSDLVIPGAIDSLWETVSAQMAQGSEEMLAALKATGLTAGQLLGIAIPEGFALGIRDGKAVLENAQGEIIDLATLANEQAQMKTDANAVGKETTEGFADGEKTATPQVETASSGVHDAAKAPLEPLPEELGTIGTEATTALQTSITDSQTPIRTASQTVADAAVQEFLLSMSAENGTAIGTAFVQAIIDAINSLASTLTNAAYNASRNAYYQANQTLSYSAGYTIGQNFGRGLASGISAMESTVRSAAQRIAAAAASASKNALAIKSPSRVMQWVGEMFGEGFAEGIRQRSGDVADEADEMARLAADMSDSPIDMLINEADIAALVAQMQAALDKQQLTIAANATSMDAALHRDGTYDQPQPSRTEINIEAIYVGDTQDADETIDELAEAVARRFSAKVNIQNRYRGALRPGR